MQAYLDNSATTRCSERAKDLMVKVLMEDYGKLWRNAISKRQKSGLQKH